MKEVQDHWFRLAKEQGYRARSAFKLLEMDERFRLLRPGAVVLDAGAAPGSWTQVASRVVGSRGRVVAVDLKAVDPRGLPPNVELVQGDLETLDPARFPPGHFHVVLSDIGPDTSGVPMADSAVSVRLCHSLLNHAATWLRPGGDLVMKVYEGAEYPGLLRRAQGMFASARGFKPKSSRAESVEMFIICQGLRGAGAPGARGAGRRDPEEPPPPPRREAPGAGWARPE